ASLTTEPSRLAGELQAWGLTRADVPADPASRHEPVMRALGGAGQHDEVELVAREMLALLNGDREPGGTPLLPSDILGVAPTSSYLDALHEACVRLGVPVASPRRQAVLDVPLVRALLE